MTIDKATQQKFERMVREYQQKLVELDNKHIKVLEEALKKLQRIAQHAKDDRLCDGSVWASSILEIVNAALED